MRNRLEGEPMDILHLGGEGQRLVRWQHCTPGFRIQEWSKTKESSKYVGVSPPNFIVFKRA